MEESVEEESYSRPSSSSGRLPSKYLSADTDSDAFPGLDGATGYQQELSDIGKGSGASLPSYGSEGLDETDYSSSLSSLGLQSYSSPSLPKSELSYLLNKMPRGFSPVPAASSYGMDLGGGSRLGYPYGFPSRPARRPYAPAPYAPSPYLKVSLISFCYYGNEADLLDSVLDFCHDFERDAESVPRIPIPGLAGLKDVPAGSISEKLQRDSLLRSR